ncbi:coenzyme A pyrophosphatase [Salinibacter sp. 10B]|uniref:NUDIX hydrolase n=1 Tax=Salinibacter sp. 10B TaxID=1923971 RepID=UPI000CF3847C|nr:CoA pyrophosphatase [Salinibacter sp. 10B]PQJ33994.1 coenzyme A pyrophosphatase [Salinibacter sp. 10B]
MSDVPTRLREALTARLADPLPGHAAHRTMAPDLSPRRNALSVDGQDCRTAGVLVLLHPQDDEWVLVLTVRREELPDHGGQISFPGGQMESNETLDETALREAQEEVGLDPSSATLLGPLTPLYIPPSNFCVHPFLGMVDHAPVLAPTDREVGQVLRASLPRLLNPATRTVEPWTLHGQTVDVPYYDVNGHTVWGATAMMLAEALAVIRDVWTSE